MRPVIGQSGRQSPNRREVLITAPGNSNPEEKTKRRPAQRERRGNVVNVRSVAVNGLFLLAALYTLYFAQAFLLPLVLAVLLSFLLLPLVRGLRRIKIPDAVGAAMVVLGMLFLVGVIFYQLSGPAALWLSKAPQNLREVQERMSTLHEPVAKMSRAAEQVEDIASLSNGQGKERRVELRPARLSETIFSGTWYLVATGVTTVVLLYFLLASGDLFLRRAIRLVPQLNDKRTAFLITRSLEQNISTYLFSITLINLGLGAAVGGAMYLLGMPNPLLWGVVAAVLNFIPYLGALVGLAIITGVALVTFDGVGWTLLTSFTYFSLTGLEGLFIKPLILGRRLTLNPVVIFVGLIFWSWLWGIAGALLAVPILSTLKLACDNIEHLKPLAELMES